MCLLLTPLLLPIIIWLAEMLTLLRKIHFLFFRIQLNVNILQSKYISQKNTLIEQSVTLIVADCSIRVCQSFCDMHFNKQEFIVCASSHLLFTYNIKHKIH